jgi:ABC-2 type transport system ATP-binding protein
MLSSKSSSPIVDAQSLTKKFGTLTAVDGISLRLAPGECLAILGPNGAGKTTTVEMLEGLVPPTSGRLSIFDMDMQKERKAILERVGVLLQETNMYKRYTVKETLELFASFYKNPDNPLDIIDRMNLKDKTNVQLKNLSGGQKQRVYLGACLINNPELIFLDEPTTGLDPQSRRSIWDLLNNLKSQHKSMILTTHYMEEAEKLADRIIIFDQGKIIAEGTLDQLISKHCDGQVITFSLAKNQQQILSDELPGILLSLKPENQVFKHAVAVGNRVEIVTQSASTMITAILDTLRKLNFEIQELNMRSGSLEDVFIKLTGRSIRDA